MIGAMALNLLPFRIGEFIRAYVLGRREDMSMSAIFATIVVERVFDGICILLLLPIALFFMPLDVGPKVMAWVKAFSFLGGAIFVTAIVFLVLIRLKIALVLRLAEILLTPIPRLREPAARAITAFAGGLEAVKSFRLLLTISVLSLAVWLSVSFFYWLLMFAFQQSSGVSIGVHVGPWGSIFVMTAVALGIMLPSSPGFVGTFELAAITALTSLGVDSAAAESYTIVIHAVLLVPVSLVGIIYLYMHNFSMREIRTSSRTAVVQPKAP